MRKVIAAFRHTVGNTHIPGGSLWTNDRPAAETSTWQHASLTRDIHAPGGIRTRNPGKRAAQDPRLLDRATLFLHGRRLHRVDGSGRVAVNV